MYKAQVEEDRKAIERIANMGEPGIEALTDYYHFDKDFINKQQKMGVVDISQEINKMWYSDDSNKKNLSNKALTGNLADLFDKL